MDGAFGAGGQPVGESLVAELRIGSDLHQGVRGAGHGIGLVVGEDVQLTVDHDLESVLPVVRLDGSDRHRM